MPARVEIKGTGDFRKAAAELRAAGDGRLRREMGRNMRAAARPAVNAAQDNVRSLKAPATGRGGGGQQRREFAMSRTRSRSERAKRKAFEGRGLRATIARAVRLQMSTGARSASVRIRTQTRFLPEDQRKLPKYMDDGRWRHPVFGNRDRWVTQTARPAGWFESAMRRHGPRVRDGAAKAVNDIINKLAK
ncbi:hypothetical protein SAMN05216215_10973 [Saccharopolyspora shandongensis]|uniref:Uncharacterized protein n=1 Tax=Saccharopolyspora shandongensis TaxID=418495 RepID=A0A1H3TZD3_9PSEU|nr:hypothetical protein [Saccharopolyspora shandongensis]SDZ55141.1 hypothetical protein SAMN05216215_10973 [Saccharopolyspora shandongensis]